MESPTPTSPKPRPAFSRTLSLRAILIGVAGMVFLAIWVHFHEVLVPAGSILAENSPPAGAVGIFLAVLLAGAFIAWLRPRLRLAPGELVVIYTMLVTAAPLMSQGMWHRFLGFVVAIPHNRHNFPLVDSYSDRLWPHGPHLLANRRFTHPPGPELTSTPPGALARITTDTSPAGPLPALELTTVASTNPAAPEPVAEMRIRVPRFAGTREQLVPSERYYLNALFRIRGATSQTALRVTLVSDGGESADVIALRGNTITNFANPGGFQRIGQPYVNMPRDLKEHVDLVFRLEGDGRAAITDIAFFSNEALWRLHKGSREVAAPDLERLPQGERDSLVVRPRHLFSPAGIAYALRGYVPYAQWAAPLLFWLSIVLAVFLCLLGISVIFRRQWADNERFAFPLAVLPRLLIEESGPPDRPVRALFRKPAFRAGLLFALLYTTLQGLAHYIPGMPNPTIDVNLEELFESPAMKALMRGFSGGTFTISLLFLSIAFFVDLDMLLSIQVFFWLSKVPYFLGEVFGWKNLKGPLDNFPFSHEQHIGSFLGLALVVVWVSRKHLRAVGRTVLGRPGGIDDSGETMRYRRALLLIAASFAFFGLWGNMTGLGAGNALLFFGFLVVCGLSASRIRTECGAPTTYFTPYFPYLIFFLLGGLRVFSTETMVLAYCAGGFMAVAQFLMFAPTQVEMMHLGNQVRARPGGIGWGLLLGILGGVLLGGYVMLVWAYGVGGENIPYMKSWAIRQDWYFTSLRDAIIEANAKSVATGAAALPTPAYPTGPVTAVATGTGITLLLTFLRTRFVGFWLHPIGYILANTYFIYMCWGSLLAAWVVKALALRIGGPSLIRRHMAPFFAGVFCGGIAGIVLWDVVGLVNLSRGVKDVFCAFP